MSPKPSISPQDISVVVQGPLQEGIVDLSVESVRRWLPGAELIVSTWKGSDHPCLRHADRVVYCEDPGAFPIVVDEEKDRNIPNNVNRQIVSTRAGLDVATRPYVLKIRSDIELTGANGFLHWLEAFPHYSPDMHFLRGRIVANASGSRAPSMRWYCFHPGDFLFFGLKEDLQKLFSVPLYEHHVPLSEVIPKDATNDLLRTMGGDSWVEQIRRTFRCEFCPEIYLFRSFLLNHLPALSNYRSMFDFSPEWAALSDQLTVNHFLYLQDNQLGIRCLKYPHYERDQFMSTMDYRIWQEAYRKYCDPSHVVSDQPSDYRIDEPLVLLKRRAQAAIEGRGFESRLKIMILRRFYSLSASFIKSHRPIKNGYKQLLRSL